MDVQEELKNRIQQVKKWSGNEKECARMDGHYEALQKATGPGQKVTVTWINGEGRKETITGAISYDGWWHCYLNDKNKGDPDKLFSVSGFVEIVADEETTQFIELYDIESVEPVTN